MATRRNALQTARATQVTLTKSAAQEKFLIHLRSGLTINSALDKVGRSRKTYEAWRKESDKFKELADQAQALRTRGNDAVRGERLGFEEFRRKYLKTETWWHQHQWIDLVEGREPRDLHPAQTYEPGKRNKLLINVPPFHAKSTTLTVDYVTYRLCMDPSFRVLIISAGQTLASQFLFAIKQRLSSPEYIDLQMAYAPDGGWESTAESWSETQIVFGTDVRAQGSHGSAEKDPNVQAVGMGSKIYGRRADMILVDDAVDATNVNYHEKQRKWLLGTVASRLEAAGKMIVVGTRMASVDLYSELRNPDNYGNGRTPWTYMASPAILEEGATPEQHVTLWPLAEVSWVNQSEDLDECLCEGTDPTCAGVEVDGETLYSRWNGIHLEMGPRADNDPQQWALIYQQTTASDDSSFPAHAVKGATNGLRLPGRLIADRAGHPIGGMHGKYVIGSCDPSIKGFAGIVVYAVDKATSRRFLLNAWNLKAPTPADLKAEMKRVTADYGVNEWRVEKTGLLQFFTQDEELRVWMSNRGVLFKEHNTGANKWDAGFGVASMSGLFGQWDKAKDPHGRDQTDWIAVQPPLIELPRAANESMKALVHQLVIWTPHLDPARTPCDLVMALWFAEIGARDYLGKGRTSNIRPFGRASRFLSSRSRKTRGVVNLADLRQEQDGYE